QEPRPVITPLLAFSKRQLIHHIGDDYVPVVKVRAGAVEAEIVNVSRRAAVGGGQTSTRSCSHRIHRHIINGLAQGVAETKIQPLLKAPAEGDKSSVIVGITAGIEEEDLSELRIRTEGGGRK